jgi:hypothetical protein
LLAKKGGQVKSALAVVLLFFSTLAAGQNSRYDSIAFGPKGTNSWGPIIKVDVTFSVSATNDHLNDTIKSISKPYLENPFFD